MDEPHDAPGVGPSLGGSGACPTVTHGSKTWTIGHPTQKAKTVLEILTLEIAAENHEAALPALPPKMRARKEKEFGAAVDGGHWRTWGELWTAVNSGPDSNALFLLSLLREHHPDATLADARTLWRDSGRATARAFAVVIPSFFTLLVAERSATPEERAAMVVTAVAEAMQSIQPLLAEPPSSG